MRRTRLGKERAAHLNVPEHALVKTPWGEEEMPRPLCAEQEGQRVSGREGPQRDPACSDIKKGQSRYCPDGEKDDWLKSTRPAVKAKEITELPAGSRLVNQMRCSNNKGKIFRTGKVGNSRAKSPVRGSSGRGGNGTRLRRLGTLWKGEERLAENLKRSY